MKINHMGTGGGGTGPHQAHGLDLEDNGHCVDVISPVSTQSVIHLGLITQHAAIVVAEL